jgi:malonyl-CoA O-methyltransferase
MTRGLFVTGTDTDVGKTIASAALVRALDGAYWKPVQSGTDELPNGDSGTVAHLAALPPERVLAPRHAFASPLSPDQAAALEGRAIALDDFTLPPCDRPLLVEGAGGVLVPLNDDALMIDLMERLGLPVVVVARSGLGTINHTLLTLAALRGRGLVVAGVVLIGPDNARNRAAIEHFGAVRIIGQIPPLTPLTPQTLAEAARGLDIKGLLP